jgi:hypothetical protein
MGEEGAAKEERVGRGMDPRVSGSLWRDSVPSR